MPEDNLSGRVSALEEEMAQVRHELRDASAARILAAGAHEEVGHVSAKLRGNEGTLHALRETQLEHGQRLDRLEDKFDANFRKTDANFRQVDANFRTVEEKFTQVNGGIAHITELLTPDGDDKGGARSR